MAGITGPIVSIPAPTGTADPRAVSLVVSPLYLPTGLTASGRLVFQPYRAASDGTSPMKIGNPSGVIATGDIFKLAATDAAVAALLAAIMPALQALATAKGF